MARLLRSVFTKKFQALFERTRCFGVFLRLVDLPRSLPAGGRDRPTAADSPDIEIVGVIADTKYNGVRDPILNTVYLPAGQTETLVRLQNEE